MLHCTGVHRILDLVRYLGVARLRMQREAPSCRSDKRSSTTFSVAWGLYDLRRNVSLLIHRREIQDMRCMLFL